MWKSKELKKLAKEQFYHDKELKKIRKAEIKQLPADEQTAAKKSDRRAAKEAKKARKASIKAMSKEDKKKAKKYDKYYKKLETRPRRYAILSVVMVAVFLLVVKFGPVIGDIRSLMKVEVKSNTEASKAAVVYGENIAEAISDEGIVLLKNEDNSLPLQDKKVNVFGLSAMNFRIGGGGSGGGDTSRAVDFYQGLENAGIDYNQDLHKLYSSMKGKKNGSTGITQVLSGMFNGDSKIEPSIDYLTEEMMANAKSYSKNALIVISNNSVEAMDAKPEDLKLSTDQAALIDKVAKNFDNVIIVVNAGNARELGFIDKYPSIKSALWVGTPGPRGANSLGNVLVGKINPSGRVVDTYVHDIMNHPAIVNFGDYKYTNLERMSFLNYEEGIYTGYRFFETYYQGDEAGYQATVQYPFGYGLSYTDFTWEVVHQSMDMKNIKVDVKVTNTGKMAGKDVVQLYFSAPYRKGGIEKSAIELAGYAKTSLLEPGQSEIVSIQFATRDMSSYDMNKEEAYVLEAGTYKILPSKNVHEPIKTLAFEVSKDVVYKEDEATGTTLTNQFDYAKGNLTYLSRADWKGTYPDISDMSFEAPADVVEAYNTKPEVVKGVAPTTGKDNGIMLKDLKGLAYDDPKWDLYLDQFTVEEMNKLVNNGAYGTIGVDRLGLPKSTLLDGPAGINFFFKAITAASFPTEVVIASTWNDELSYKWGEAIGKEANILGVQGWYAPAVNIHRSPLGGRNFEYFSEDPLLSGKMGANAIQGAQSQKILVFLKHFALNEQETNARSGVMVWANEQAIRENYLRSFEIAVKEGKVTGVMSSFILIGHKWAGGNPELLQNVLRDEWGFVGLVSTDAAIGSFMDLNLAIRNGNDLMLAIVPTFNERYFKRLYKEDPVGVTIGVRERTHNICYALLEYTGLIK